MGHLKNVIMVWLGVLSLLSCLGPDCGSGGKPKQGSTGIEFQMILKGDSLRAEYLAYHSPVDQIQIFEKLSEALHDTAKIAFYGTERFFDKRMNNSIQVDGDAIFIRHYGIDSMQVEYIKPENTVEILKKVSCTPLEPLLKVDSIVITHSIAKKIKFIVR